MRLLTCCALGAVASGLVFAGAAAAKPVDFVTDVKPIFEMNCVSCHNAQHAEENGKYRIDTKEEAFKPHKKDQRILPGHPDDSEVYYQTTLPLTDESHMPPAKLGKTPLTKEQSETLRQWIAEGAHWPDGVTLKVVMKVEFARDIEPILEKGGPISDQSKETLRLWLAQGAVWPAGVSFPSAKSPAAGSAPAAGQVDFAREVQPILATGGPLTDAARETLSKWVEQGAAWPAEVKLGPAKGGAQAEGNGIGGTNPHQHSGGGQGEDGGGHEGVHQHHSRHLGDLRDGADCRGRVSHGQPGHAKPSAMRTKGRSTGSRLSRSGWKNAR